jgi:hypothetical protein
MNRKHLVSLMAATLWIGCGMGDELPPTIHTDSGVPKTDTGTTPKKLAPPVVDALPNTVCSETVPLQGSAAAGVSVFVMGGLATSGLATDANPSSGRFCIDVPLKKGAVNTLEVRAQDPVLGLSEAVTVKVTHGGTCQDDVPNPPPTPPKSQNVALGIKGKASTSDMVGNEGFVTDGKTSTNMQVNIGSSWYCPWCDVEGWFTIKLDKLTEIEKVVVKWRDATGSTSLYYGSKFKILVSAMSDPGDPNIKNGYWTEVGDVTSGTGGTNTFDLKSTKPIAQHVAMWLMQDGSGNVTEGWFEHFAISELEVWDAPKTTTPTPTNQTNTCANISGK